MEKYYISQIGYSNLSAELSNISNQINDLIRKMGESAKRDNDLRENQEFLELRVKAMYQLPKKRDELRRKYESAIIIQDMDEYKKFNGERVIIGTSVTLSFNGDICIYTILGNDEGDLDNNVLSCEAPLSKAILHKKTGDTINFGNNIIKILNVEKYQICNH